MSVRPGRSRVLAIAASVLLSGAALAAAALPAQAATAAKPDPVAEATAVTNPGPTTGPLETAITLPLTATESDAFKLTPANTVTVASPGTQASIAGTAITPLQIVATDTDTTATLTYTAENLPTGLAINPATGVISGTPTVPGNYPDATVTATDSTAATGSVSFIWGVAGPDKIVVTAPKSEATWLGLAVKVQATATDSDKSQTITWSAEPLPPGLSISKTGLISGRTTATGLFKTVVTATDGTDSAGSATVEWNVGVPITVHSAGSVTTTAGRSVAYKLAYSDVVKGDKVTWAAAGLPAGVGFQQSSLLLYGWPTGVGAHTVVFKAKGALGTSDQKVVKLVVKAAPDTGAVGQLHLALDGKCLQDPGDRTANGTRVEIASCVTGATERWTVASDNTIRANGRCLNIAGSGTANGKQLQLSSCTGSTRQVWLQGSDGELVNPASGLCVTDPGSNRNNGVTPTMGTCHARSSQEWTLPAQPILTPVGDACADDPLGLGYNGTVIDMYACNGTAGQAWDFEPNGTIKISQYSNVCLTVHDSRPELWVCGAAGDQKWSVNRTGGLGSELTAGGVCLAAKSLTAANATKLVMAKCSAANPLDLWHIE